MNYLCSNNPKLVGKQKNPAAVCLNGQVVVVALKPVRLQVLQTVKKLNI